MKNILFLLTLTGSCFSHAWKLLEAEEAVKNDKGWLNLDELKTLVEE